MEDNGFIKIYRKMLEWEWYTDVNTKILFLHCLLKANFRTKKFQKNTVKRGSFVTSISHLSEETGLSIRQTRTALEHLISTGELTSKSSSKNRIITVVNYDKFQDSDKQNDRQTTNKRQTKRQATDKRPTTVEERKNVYVSPTEIHIREETKKRASPAAEGGGSHEVSVAEIKKFAAAVPGGDDYIACDFRRAFIRSKTKFPDDWKEIFTRFAAADKTSQSEFLDKLQSGAYREKWGSEDT